MLWLCGFTLAGGLFESYFFSLGMQISDIYFANLFWFASSLLLIPLFKKFKSRAFLLSGIAISLFSVMILFFFADPSASFIYRFVLGATHLFFWVPFNILFFEYNKNKDGIALHGALYYSLGPAVSLAMPAIAGAVASMFGFPLLFLLGAIFYCAAFILGFIHFEDREYEYGGMGCLKSIDGLGGLIFLEGLGVNIIVSLTLPVMLLLFIEKPAEFGFFLSLVTIFSIAAAFITAKMSDGKGQRRLFLLPSVAAVALSAVFASFAGNLLLFFIAFGLVRFFQTVFGPLAFALSIDNSRSLARTMAARELMLNSGRIVGGAIGYILILLFDIQAALIIQGALLLAYIPLFEIQKRKLLRN